MVRRHSFSKSLFLKRRLKSTTKHYLKLSFPNNLGLSNQVEISDLESTTVYFFRIEVCNSVGCKATEKEIRIVTLDAVRSHGAVFCPSLQSSKALRLDSAGVTTSSNNKSRRIWVWVFAWNAPIFHSPIRQSHWSLVFDFTVKTISNFRLRTTFQKGIPTLVWS